MKTLTSVLLLAALSAYPAAASELPLGAPSEPTIFGHPVETREAPALEPLTIVRQERTAPSVAGREPSEPTIWGHRLPERDPRTHQGAE